MFQIPPSGFSEKVLKVPGKVNISNVIVNFQLAHTSLRPPTEPMTSHLPPNKGVDDVRYPEIAGVEGDCTAILLQTLQPHSPGLTDRRGLHFVGYSPVWIALFI